VASTLAREWAARNSEIPVMILRDRQITGLRPLP
jgi:hypothetical protein